MILQLYTVFAIPLVLALLLTPAVIRLARKVGALDQPNERKVHQNPIPRMGGVAIFGSFFLALTAATIITPDISPFVLSAESKGGLYLFLSLTLVLIIGIWDDIKQITPAKKFAGQLVAATIVYFAGFKMSAITNPLHFDILRLGYLDFPATIIWIIGITNAFNLIDGLDGLAPGVAFIVALTISSISFLKSDMTTAIMALILAGSVLGFLRYNFHNARIFLGDSGSLFLGFSLAILSMQSSAKGATAFSIMVPMLTLGLPIMDTLLSMVRRLIRSMFPENIKKNSFGQKLFSMFLPDRGHIHHQLVARGLSHRAVVIVLYIVSSAFGIGAFAVTVTNDISSSFIIIAIGIATFIGLRELRYKEMAVLRNGMLLPLYEWPLLNSSLFQGFLDLAFVIISFLVAYTLALPGQLPVQPTLVIFRSIALICGVQLVVFHVGGLYKGTFRHMGLGDLLGLLKVVTASIVISWAILSFMGGRLGFNLTAAILDFYLLLSLVVGRRVSFHILNYLSRREPHDGKQRVIIYGANSRGLLILQQILEDKALNLQPVGFIDDDPSLEGRSMNGYPIFGGHWKLEPVIRKMSVMAVLLCTDSIKNEALRRVQRVTRTHGIMLKKVGIQLDDVTPFSATLEEIAQGNFDFADKR
jgi:UDP-GlcNAc:undecaprenyl-phosphate/decaprenyl-phosphate GlcNAc-1-phosphate transferase